MVFDQTSMFGRLPEQLAPPQYISSTLRSSLMEESKPTTPAWMELLEYISTIKEERVTSFRVLYHWVVGYSRERWKILTFTVVGPKLEN